MSSPKNSRKVCKHRWHFFGKSKEREWFADFVCEKCGRLKKVKIIW